MASLLGCVRLLMSNDLFFEADLVISSPKHLRYEVIPAKMACEYNEEWHSRLPKIHWSNVVRNTHYVCFAAVSNSGQVVAVGIWSSPVAQNRFQFGKQILELRRLAISDMCPRNTATHMLRFMRNYVKNNFKDIALLISYQDTDVHTGTIYKADNWINAATSAGLEWNTEARKRNKEQSLAVKVRWEYKLREFSNAG